MKLSKISLISISSLIFIALLFVSGSRASAQEVNNKLPSDDDTSLVVSDVPKTNESFRSPVSYAYIYVPAGAENVRLNVRDIGQAESIPGGRLTSAAIWRLNKKTGQCDRILDETYNTLDKWAGFSNNRSIITSNQGTNTESFKVTFDGTAKTFNVYCAVVSTSVAIEWDGRGGFAENVVFKLTTNSNSFLGAYPGSAKDRGTGYFQTGVSRGSTWSQSYDFAVPCNGNVSGSANPIKLYDLDNGTSQSTNIEVWVVRYDRDNPGTPIGGVPLKGKWNVSTARRDLRFSRTGFGIPIYFTEGWKDSVYSNNYEWSMWPKQAFPNDGNVPWREDSIYRLTVSGIGWRNKIRVRLPFDQFNAKRTCPDPPTATASCTAWFARPGSPNTAVTEIGINQEVILRARVWRDTGSGSFTLNSVSWDDNPASNIGNGSISPNSTISNSTGARYTLKSGIVFTTVSQKGVTVTADVSLPGNPNCGTIYIDTTRSPYLRVYGNDVEAGGGLLSAGGSCDRDNSARVYARGNFEDPSNPSQSTYRGSAVELAIFATGNIRSVLPGSQTNRTPFNKFAYSGIPQSGGAYHFGGDFTPADINCREDHFAQAPDSNPAGLNESQNIIFIEDLLNNYTQREFIFRPNSYDHVRFKMRTGATIPPGERIEIYVDGNAYLWSDDNPDSIRYGGVGSWANADSIPYLKIVARGNLYVGRNTNRIDGVYVAQERNASVGGNIFTCAWVNTPVSTGNVANPVASGSEETVGTTCTRNLTVNGALIAKRIHFTRSGGDVLGGSPQEAAGDGPAAEKIIFRPELYISTLKDGFDLSGGGAGQPTQVDSLIALPPSY